MMFGYIILEEIFSQEIISGLIQTHNPNFGISAFKSLEMATSEPVLTLSKGKRIVHKKLL
jgi:hypothetical protein